MIKIRVFFLFLPFFIFVTLNAALNDGKSKFRVGEKRAGVKGAEKKSLKMNPTSCGTNMLLNC